jgi:putative tricarboxylic transport membrane protein
MAERALNCFWIVLGIAATMHAAGLGLFGPSGPESGLFPFIAGVLIAATGVVLLVGKPSAARPVWPRGPALWRVAGVVAGLAFLAGATQYLGFAIASAITMLVLLRSVERTGWIESLAITVAAVLVVMGLFGHLLGMPLPRGPWGW